MSQENQKYYIGLDCGTSSVGWAVTDDKYNLLCANGKVKKEGKTKTKKRALWGVRLFDEADTAAERRTFRSSRRRSRRAKDRLKLLRLLFRDEMLKVDPEFYKRLHESFYYEEDKHLRNNSRNTLFNDKNFTDKDFHKKYPTIWHLRQAIIGAAPDEHFDLRLYFLAIQHILKHRGHFLNDGKLKDGRGDFNEIFSELCDVASNYGFEIEDTMQDSVERIILSDLTLTDKKKQLKGLALFREQEESEEDSKKISQRQNCLCELIAGSSVDLAKLFDLETDEKHGYSLSQLDEKESEIAEIITLDNISLLLSAKKLYDYGVLSRILGDKKFISDAMVDNYNRHQQDLLELKGIFKPHQELYRKLFKSEVFDEKFPSYNAYIGNAYTEDKQGRRATKRISQEDFNKHLAKLLKEINYSGKLLERAEKGELLPKQRGQAKGTIPQQLHHNELDKILEKLAKDYPSLGEEVSGENEDYNTKCKKISLIHSFRIPYYCGPLVKRKYNDKGELVNEGKSEFSWADQEITELVRPWNFHEIVNKDVLAENFIRRMTNECTYLLGEEVLPKNSLLYQKYMVLNELNNLRINGRPLDLKVKQEIYERAFKNSELKDNITFRKLQKWLKDNQFISAEDELSGTSEAKVLPKLKTYQDFTRILGSNFEKQYSQDKLEKVVEAITILGEEKDMLRRKIASTLSLDIEDKRVKDLAKLSYKDWGRFSAKFLNGITVDDRTVLDWLWESQYNLQQLIGQEVGFEKKIEEYNTNSGKKPKAGIKIKYSDVRNLYCSPAVKRSVWQTVKIVDELIKACKTAPAKIFLEVTRGEDKEAKGKYTLARKKDLENKLKAVKSPESRELLKTLDGYDDQALRQKKLFLYFSQMGKCAYSGERISLEELNNTQLYDIDHIYPRSKTKDDSITRNLVLVKAELNREKTNIYPIADNIRKKMHGEWTAWRRAELITKEKYERLVRQSPLTRDELGSFIARQIVETSQTVKAIRDLLKQAYPKTEIVLVKAGQVSDFRHLFANGTKYKNSDQYKILPRPEFIKIRELNDFHHAKDAYLNIVVGNVMNETFTSNPYEWIKQRNGQEYSINPERIFRDSWEYRKTDGSPSHYPDTQGWNFAESIQLVSDIMKRNDILWTRMSYIESGQISDLQIVGKTQKTDGILPIKQDKRLVQVNKYGGYNSIKGAYFALIECKDKKGELQRRIVSIPQIYKDNIENYISKKYNGAKIIIPVIKYKSKFEYGGVPLHLAYKTGNQIGFQHAIQLVAPEELRQGLKRVSNLVKKVSNDKKYVIDEEKDRINHEKLDSIYEFLSDKIQMHRNTPTLNATVLRFGATADEFNSLDIREKCLVIASILKVLSCNAEKGDLSVLLSNAKSIGSILLSTDISGKNLCLINQSPTGLYEEHIDLKTVQPKISKSKTNRES